MHPTTHSAGSEQPGAATRAANAAFAWAAAFTLMHVYWFLGGRVGFGDQQNPLPPAPTSLGGWIIDIIELLIFAAGLAVPLALTRAWGRRAPRRLLIGLMWIGSVILLARGGAGLLDDALRFTGLGDGGITGLSTETLLGSAHPTTYTTVSTIGLDSIFCLGGLLFGNAARLARTKRVQRQADLARQDLPS